ncbi:MAG: peptidoglycan-binding protein [Candidatus Omnitrophota bacterium]
MIFFLCTLCGCDFIYGILQKEGAQEKKILGSVVPSVYNKDVEYVQKLLLVHGFSPGRIDGKLGGKMREAIAKFQADKGLSVTRFIDDQTWEALNILTATGLVEDGELNFVVIQEILKAGGFYSGKIDGKTGPKTQKSIKAFQKANGLDPDGRIGPKTLSKLSDFLLSH